MSIIKYRYAGLFALYMIVVLALCMATAFWGLGGANAATEFGTLAAQGSGMGAAEGKLLGLTVNSYSDYVKVKVSEAERKMIRHHKVPIWWVYINTAPGVFDWSQTDEDIKAILADGSQSILFLLQGPVPVWARDPAYGRLADLSPPLQLKYWEDFCSAVSARYGAVVDFYEIWNEPGWDIDGQANKAWGVYFLGGQVEREYLPMLRVAYSAIKKNDPSAKIICGDLPSSIDPDVSKGTELLSQLFDDESRPGEDMSLQVSSDQPVIAQCPVYLKRQGVWEGGQDVSDNDEAAREWNLRGGSSQHVSYTWLCLENPQDKPAKVTLTFYMARGEVIQKSVEVPAGSRQTLNVNYLLGFRSYCDMVALHDYKPFWNWGDFYSRCVQALRATGSMQELVVTEVGCPHASDSRPDPYSPELQLKAVGDVGLGSLFEHGCRKIWYYTDIDHPSGTSWDSMYYGLFNYRGNPMPAWEEYKRWQSQLPAYPPLPSSWTPPAQ